MIASIKVVRLIFEGMPKTPLDTSVIERNFILFSSAILNLIKLIIKMIIN